MPFFADAGDSSRRLGPYEAGVKGDGPEWLTQTKIDPCDSSNGDVIMNRIVGKTGKRVWELSPFSKESVEGVPEEQRKLEDAFGLGNNAEGAHGPRNLGVNVQPEDIRNAAGDFEEDWLKRPLLGMQEFPLALQRRYAALSG